MNTATKNTLRLLPFILAALVFAFALALPAFAQAAAAADAPIVMGGGNVAEPDGSSLTTIISIVVALVSGLVAIWQRKEASTARKVTESIVLGVEQATKLPQVQAAEKQIKAKIRQQATDLGVEPLLNRVVKDLT